jgi:hypothetical protein
VVAAGAVGAELQAATTRRPVISSVNPRVECEQGIRRT